MASSVKTYRIFEHLEQMSDFREAVLRGLSEHAVFACEFRSGFATIAHRVREQARKCGTSLD